ncbi:MAG: hypothetical protein ACHQD9_00060 [Chitinophagales bacterium]
MSSFTWKQEKFIFFFVVALFISHLSYSQVNLDDRKFAINMFRGGTHDSFDTLYFSKGNLTYYTARKYGFQSAPYKAKEKKDETIVGTATNESKANGVMVWNFVVMNDSIAGTASFDTRVQNPVNYDFTGKEAK